FAEPRCRVYKPVAVRSTRRSAFHRHAATSAKGQVSHDADRLASTRARRAAAARALSPRGPPPRCRSTFHQAPDRQTPNAAARNCRSTLSTRPELVGDNSQKVLVITKLAAVPAPSTLAITV